MDNSFNSIKDRTLSKWFATINEAKQIFELQKKNLKENLSPEDKKSQGFLSLNNSIEEIEDLINDNLVIVIKDWEKVVWYEIVITLEKAQKIAFEKPLLDNSSNMEYLWKPLVDYKYCIMWQTCVDTNYRWMKIPEMLKNLFIEKFWWKFDLWICEISEENTRSINAHIGKLWFKVIWNYNHDWTNRIVSVCPLKENIELMNTIEGNI